MTNYTKVSRTYFLLNSLFTQARFVTKSSALKVNFLPQKFVNNVMQIIAAAITTTYLTATMSTHFRNIWGKKVTNNGSIL